MMITFTVPGQPIGKGRPRVASRGGKFAQLYTDAKTVSYEGLVAHTAQAAMHGRPLLAGPVSVSLEIRLQVPASWSKKQKAAALTDAVRPTKKPDVDNVIKAIFDGMNGVVWDDDVQAVEVSARKFYHEVPGVMVSARAIT